MTASELAELSGLIAVHGATFLQGAGRLSESGLGQYWSAAKARFGRWMQVLRGASSTSSAQVPTSPAPGHTAAPVVEEIFTSELLTRVWTALVYQYDRRQGSCYAGPVVRCVQRGHLDARCRALQWMCQATDRESQAVSALDQLRRRSEHWTDLLLAHLVPAGEAEVCPLAFDLQRLQQFVADLDELRHAPHGNQAWHLFQASLKAAFRTSRRPNPSHTTLNAQIAASILTCFPPELFDSTGVLRSLWLERLRHTARDTEAMVQDLLRCESLT